MLSLSQYKLVNYVCEGRLTHYKDNNISISVSPAKRGYKNVIVELKVLNHEFEKWRQDTERRALYVVKRKELEDLVDECKRSGIDVTRIEKCENKLPFCCVIHDIAPMQKIVIRKKLESCQKEMYVIEGFKNGEIVRFDYDYNRGKE